MNVVFSSGYAGHEVSRGTTPPEDPATTTEWDRPRCTKGKCRVGTLRVIAQDGDLHRRPGGLPGKLDLLEENEDRAVSSETSHVRYVMRGEKAILAEHNDFSHVQESTKLLQSYKIIVRSHDGNDTQRDHCHKTAGSMAQGFRTNVGTANIPAIRTAPNFRHRRMSFRKGWKHLELTELTRTFPVPEPFEHGSDPYSRPAEGTRFFTLQLRQSATHDSPHETAEIERKSNDPDKKRPIQIHPSWLVGKVVLYVL